MAQDAGLKNFFDSQNEVKQLIGDKELLVFLDYDGTLTPIVATPDLAVLSDEMRQTIKDLAALKKVAIVSGRATDDVRSKVQIDGLFYAGSHGFEIYQPDGNVEINDEAKAIRPVIDEAHALLAERLKSIGGALAENVKYTISAHFRLVSDNDFERFEQEVNDVLAQYPMLRKTHGKKVFELRPKIDWHKGKAVEWILNVWKFDPATHVAVYIGDDRTDEDAFAVLQDKGFGILVVEEPRETKAAYWVNNTNEVKQVLEMLQS